MSVRQCLTDLRRTGRFIIFVFSGALMAWPQLASSHHSFASVYTADGEEAIAVIEGSVRVFKIINPHGALIVNVTNEAGATEGWLIELSPAAQLAREGWTDDSLSPGDEVTVSIFTSRTPNRARLRALLIHGKDDDEAAQLLVSYGIRGDTPVMRRLRERLPVCGSIDASYTRTECFLVDSETLRSLEEEFPGHMGYVMP
jgi:hypothetical protein